MRRRRRWAKIFIRILTVWRTEFINRSGMGSWFGFPRKQGLRHVQLVYLEGDPKKQERGVGRVRQKEKTPVKGELLICVLFWEAACSSCCDLPERSCQICTISVRTKKGSLVYLSTVLWTPIDRVFATYFNTWHLWVAPCSCSFGEKR